jgi:heparan sulfate 6-O-sulfotransferase HS6ST1
MTILFLISILLYLCSNNKPSLNEISDNENFDIEKDIMVFLHIQKTGGTKLSMNIIDYLQVFDPKNNIWKKACRLNSKNRSKLRGKNHIYICPRVKHETNWFFTWHTIDYLICGNHADFVRLRNCVPQLYSNERVRNYEYISIIRHPIKRYISELGNLRRRDWDGSKNICNYEGKHISDLCFGTIRANLSLSRFLSSCETHVSKNRLVRWFAEYNETTRNCTIFNPSQSRFLLQSAKKNLLELKYFAITEYQELSQKLFEATFKNLKFSKTLLQSESQFAEKYLKELDETDDLLFQIRKSNSLDIEFYQYALKIFFDRLKMYKIGL